MKDKTRDKKETGNGLKWEAIDVEGEDSMVIRELYRIAVPTGWLVKTEWYNGMSITFVLDVDHLWLVD